MNDAALVSLIASTLCDSTCPGNCSGPALENCNAPPQPVCDKTCKEACLDTGAADCVPHAVAGFISAVKTFDATLPYTKNNGGLICYWNSLPAAGSCAVTGFHLATGLDLVGTGATPIDPATWTTITEVDCGKILNFKWPYINEIYSELFPTMVIPNSDTGKQAKAEAIIKSWIIHFGHFAIMKDSVWTELLTNLNGLTTVANWQAVSASSTPALKYKIGSNEYNFPANLATWITAGGKDIEIFNYWTV